MKLRYITYRMVEVHSRSRARRDFYTEAQFIQKKYSEIAF